MSERIVVRVIKGLVDVPDAVGAAEQRSINRWGLGHGARNFLTRRYREGEIIPNLSAGEAERLKKLGVVEVLPVR